MTVFVFFLLAGLGAVGTFKWVFTLVGNIVSRIKNPPSKPFYQSTDWWFLLAFVELVGSALTGIFGGVDAWAGWGLFIIVLGSMQLGLNEVISWVQIVVKWLKARTVPKSKS